jgi:hypothetical protein
MILSVEQIPDELRRQLLFCKRNYVKQYGDVIWLLAQISNYIPANVAERMSCTHMQTAAVLMSDED